MRDEARQARAHWGTDNADLAQQFLNALAKAGKDTTSIKASDLAGADHIHMGGEHATSSLLR